MAAGAAARPPPLRRHLPCAGNSQILRSLFLRTQPPWCTVAGCRLHFHHAELLLSFRTHAQGLATLLMHEQQLQHPCFVSWCIPRASDASAACLLAVCSPARLLTAPRRLHSLLCSGVFSVKALVPSGSTSEDPTNCTVGSEFDATQIPAEYRDQLSCILMDNAGGQDCGSGLWQHFYFAA